MKTWLAFVNCREACQTAIIVRAGGKPTFKPTPPAFKLMMSTLASREEALNPDTASLRFLTSIEPSKRYHGRPSRSSTTWIKSRKVVN